MHKVYLGPCMLLFTLFAINLLAEDMPNNSRKAGWDEAWSWGNAFAVKDRVDQLYFTHAQALLSAEAEIKSGTNLTDVVKKLQKLPGIKGGAVHIVAVDGKGASLQWPEGLLDIDDALSILLNSKMSDASGTMSPMGRRILGGKVKCQRIPLDGSQVDLMVRYAPSDALPIPSAIIFLVMDKNWLSAQLPTILDSLYRENSQLVFCAESPTNRMWEQSLGVMADGDTLWWVGRRDVQVSNVQPIWPFLGSMQVVSYVHTISR